MRIRTFIGAAFAGSLCASSPALASPYIVTLEEVGSNVVATGSGVIDTTGLTLDPSGTTFPQIIPNEALIVTGIAAARDELSGTFSGPTNFGTGFFKTADSATGDIVGLVGLNPNTGQLFVPVGYSGTTLADSATYNNATLVGLGVTPGTYVWTWGRGADQSFTLQIGPVSAVPLPATLPLFVSGLAGLGWLGRRRKKQALR